ncbi:hypothetical protein HUN41_00076 [Streptomyces phage Coruscant]|uniref:Uncharacterized protein n=1 Tax=Streptomyces phage Coruscant TaxID=2739834 RepID=A0A7G4AW15_9CAUD|nr:hypothetical protein PP454_gp212 [Streptomyces phage Coruscant]QMP84205.1 hypothetical protein HUN41_00076 [Streptomyces phage Coruscant]
MKISGSLGHTANIGDFQNVRADAGIIEFDVKPGQTVEEAFEEMYAIIGVQLLNQLKKLVDNLGG